MKSTTHCINVAPPPELTETETVVTGAGLGQHRGKTGAGSEAQTTVHSCSTPAAPFCPLPPAFIFGGRPEHSCVIAVAQCRGHSCTHTHILTDTHIHRAAYFLLLALFSYSPQQKDEVSSQLEVTPVD